jgi:hypothetical protein
VAQKKMTQAETLIQFANLFDRNIKFASLEQIYSINPCFPWEYQQKCRYCVSEKGFRNMFINRDSANKMSIDPQLRDAFIEQLRHNFLEHATMREVCVATQLLEQIQETLTESKTPTTPAPETVAMVTPEITATTTTPVTEERPLYQNVIKSLCEHHVLQLEKLIETQMLKGNHLTCIYEITPSPIRAYLMTHVDKASGGCFHMVSLGEDKCKISIKGTLSPLKPL